MLTIQIKTIIENYLNYRNLANIVFGVMLTPTKVKLSDEKEIESPFLVIPSQFSVINFTSHGESHSIDFSFKTGDKVILAKSEGGQRYVILGKE